MWVTFSQTQEAWLAFCFRDHMCLAFPSSLSRPVSVKRWWVPESFGRLDKTDGGALIPRISDSTVCISNRFPSKCGYCGSCPTLREPLCHTKHKRPFFINYPGLHHLRSSFSFFSWAGATGLLFIVQVILIQGEANCIISFYAEAIFLPHGGEQWSLFFKE